MTALENLRYFSLLLGIQSQDHHRILEMVGLQNAEKKKARQFSLGMKQRLGIAISLLGNPDFLILDEPINGLDPEGVYEIRKMLETLNREYGTTIMIASYILSELYKLATDYAIIDGGCLIDEFSKETLESACSSGVQVTVEPEHLQEAKTLIASRYPDVRCEVLSNQSLRLYEKINPADLNQFLVENKVRVSGLGTNNEDVEKLIGTFLSGDIILYAFMLLTANMIAEAYRSGAMKNIIGRGISKKKYYLSIVFAISAAYLLVMVINSIIMGVFVGIRFGMGTVSYPGYYVLSIIARILFVVAYISFAVTMAVFSRNAIAGVIFGLLIPNLPRIFEMLCGFFKIHISLDFLKISTHMPSVYAASNDLSSFLPCFVVLWGYLILSIFAGFRILKHQDIK